MKTSLTPEKCQEHARELRALQAKESDPERRRKFQVLIEVWEDLCADLESKSKR
jgi:hypothetical protein